jgi:RHS repeat-associated protein
VADNWSYNDNNELQSYDNVAFEYDANGNMTKKTDAGQVTNYIYNVEDRLTRVEDGTGSLISSYYYDPFGRRLWKEVDGIRTYFVYADEGLIAEVDEAGNVTKSYGYRPGSTWSTDPLFMKQGSEYYFYQNDHLGTPQKMTAVNGAVVWSAKYSSFGKADIDLSSTVTNNLRFAGQYYDAETGLHYNYHRYYDPKTGRYLTPDPIGLAGGINLFKYSENNPINLIDPWGLQAGTVVRPSPRGLDPSAHPVFRRGTYEHQLIANDLNRVAWIVDPVPLLRDSGHFLFGGGLGYWIYDITHRPSIYGPDDPTSIEEWKKWKGVNPDELCEEKAEPWHPIMGGYDPEDPPPPSPNEPRWKKIARVIMKLIRAANPK